MSRLIISINGIVIKEVQLTKDRTTVGRRPYNDIVLDHLAVSGEHAVIQIADGQAVLEDLGSTNGTFVNGHPVRSQQLRPEDMIDIGRYRIGYVVGSGESVRAALATAAHSQTQSFDPLPSQADSLMGNHPTVTPSPRIRVLNGSGAGRELYLMKDVTIIGKRGASVATITRYGDIHKIAHVDGEHVPSVNGVSVIDGPIRLQNRDQIVMGGTRLEYLDP